MEKTFTKVIDILFLAKQHDVEVILNDGRLQLKIPENKSIDQNLLNEIKVNKEAIINFLNNDSWRLKDLDLNHQIIPVSSNDRPSRIPLSFSQERLWFIDQFEGSLQYHITTVLRLRGKLDVPALEHSLQTIVNRHEILRTVYREENGHAYQFIKPEDNWSLEIVDGQQFEGGEGLQNYIKGKTRQPFNLSEDSMLKALLIRLGNEEHVIALTMHHIASDAWSTPILVREVVELYDSYIHGRAATLTTQPLQYTDYVLWQKGFLQGKVLEKKLNYWKEKLADLSPLDLPADYGRPSVRTARGASSAFSISPEILKGLKQLSQAYGATLYMTLLAAFKVLLYRYTGQQDICVGTSIAGRPQKDLEGLIGFFVNTLALRDELRGQMSFHELLAEVRSTLLEAYSNQEVPFEKVVDSVVKERDSARNPLFEVMLVLKNTPEVPKLHLGELELSGEPYDHTTVKFDLTFFLTETGNGIQGSVLYSTDLYKRDRIDRMIQHFSKLLTSIVSSPGEKIGMLRILTETEEGELSQEINVSALINRGAEDVVHLFEEQARKSPESAALVFERRQLTFNGLETRSNQLAHYLQSRGIVKDTLVPLYIERGLEMIIGILGILKAGGAYVPIDADFPSDRVIFMLKDTGAKVLVSSQVNRLKLSEFEGVEIVDLDADHEILNTFSSSKPDTHISQDQLAYVIYTSGSTGRPKGVQIKHKSLTDYIMGLDERTGINSCSSYALVSSIATDLGNTVLYSWLVSGGTLHIFSKEMISHVEDLHGYFGRHRIDCVKIVPSHWRALSLDGVPLLPASMLIFGGESLQAGDIQTIKNRDAKCKVFNHYGPTETTVGKLIYEVNTDDEYDGFIPIGKPFSNTRIYVLSTDGA
ncbi:condensation domain-containing protein, partial [Pedobacter sp. P351]|uniref:non-ribosomal peptide synthetase n=1 Tax=Pedobacter superstes TaxID=3133441 RepID=UPI0030AFC65A